MVGAALIKGDPGDKGDKGDKGDQGDAGSPMLFVQKVLDEQVVSSTVLQDDDMLSVPLAAAAKYLVELVVVFESATTPDIKLSLVGPVGATGFWSVHPQGAAGGGFAFPDSLALGAVVVLPGSGVGARQTALLKGLVTTVTAGVLKLQWAQNAANANAAIVHPSYLLATKVG